MSKELPVQDRLQKHNPIRGCYGCGADNPGGLKLKSFIEGDEVVGRWRPKNHHCRVPGFLNGGVASTLIDCHSAWTAFVLDCREKGLDMGAEAEALPAGWTRAMTIEFFKPTPMNGELIVRSKVIKKGKTSRRFVFNLRGGRGMRPRRGHHRDGAAKCSLSQIG